MDVPINLTTIFSIEQYGKQGEKEQKFIHQEEERHYLR